MKKIICLVLALLIPLQGCATTSASTSSADHLRAMEEVEWVDLASSHGSPESARQILEEAVDTGRDGLRVFTSDGDTVVVMDPTIRRGIIDYIPRDIIHSRGEVVGGRILEPKNIALEDVIRWQTGRLPAGLPVKPIFNLVSVGGGVFLGIAVGWVLIKAIGSTVGPLIEEP
tara:strand:- start:162 stop:677 length:516 start_codon:yes stop_codon:yes gene_type:complete